MIDMMTAKEAAEITKSVIYVEDEYSRPESVSEILSLVKSAAYSGAYKITLEGFIEDDFREGLEGLGYKVVYQGFCLETDICWG
jgi:hypothetical protein